MVCLRCMSSVLYCCQFYIYIYIYSCTTYILNLFPYQTVCILQVAVAVHLWKPSDASSQEKTVQKAGTEMHFAADTQAIHKKINTCIYVPPNAHILQYIQCILPNSDKSIFTLRLARTTLTMFSRQSYSGS